MTNNPDFDAVPINRYLGLRLVSDSPDRAEVALPVNDALGQEHGVVHGGIITTLADTAAVYLLHPRLPEGTAMTSIDLHVNFLSPAKVKGGELIALATPVRVGRRIAVCRTDVRQGERLIATGTFTYYFIENAR